jgi:hypothetical protein
MVPQDFHRLSPPQTQLYVIYPAVTAFSDVGQ